MKQQMLLLMICDWSIDTMDEWVPSWLVGWLPAWLAGWLTVCGYRWMTDGWGIDDQMHRKTDAGAYNRQRKASRKERKKKNYNWESCNFLTFTLVYSAPTIVRLFHSHCALLSLQLFTCWFELDNLSWFVRWSLRMFLFAIFCACIAFFRSFFLLCCPCMLHVYCFIVAFMVVVVCCMLQNNISINNDRS